MEMVFPCPTLQSCRRERVAGLPRLPAIAPTWWPTLPVILRPPRQRTVAERGTTLPRSGHAAPGSGIYRRANCTGAEPPKAPLCYSAQRTGVRVQCHSLSAGAARIPDTLGGRLSAAQHVDFECSGWGSCLQHGHSVEHGWLDRRICSQQDANDLGHHDLFRAIRRSVVKHVFVFTRRWRKRYMSAGGPEGRWYCSSLSYPPNARAGRSSRCWTGASRRDG